MDKNKNKHQEWFVSIKTFQANSYRGTSKCSTALVLFYFVFSKISIIYMLLSTCKRYFSLNNAGYGASDLMSKNKNWGSAEMQRRSANKIETVIHLDDYILFVCKVLLYVETFWIFLWTAYSWCLLNVFSFQGKRTDQVVLWHSSANIPRRFGKTGEFQISLHKQNKIWIQSNVNKLTINSSLPMQMSLLYIPCVQLVSKHRSEKP